MITTLNKHEVTELIDGPVGKLEVALSEPQGEDRKIWGFVCHPHPLHGGTMFNKVVTTLVKTFQGLGVTTVRFNFRGVGRSEGHYDDGVGEVLDLLAVIEWLQKQRGKNDVWLAGFSFGAYIAAKAATEIECKNLVTVAPPVQHFPMRDLPPIHCPWVVVQGEEDEVVPGKEVIEWAKTRVPKPVIIRFPEATHFFHGQLGELRLRLEEVLK